MRKYTLTNGVLAVLYASDRCLKPAEIADGLERLLGKPIVAGKDRTNAIRQALHRLKSKGLVEGDGCYSLTEEGKVKAKEYYKLLTSISHVGFKVEEEEEWPFVDVGSDVPLVTLTKLVPDVSFTRSVYEEFRGKDRLLGELRRRVRKEFNTCEDLVLDVGELNGNKFLIIECDGIPVAAALLEELFRWLDKVSERPAAAKRAVAVEAEAAKR